MSDTGLQARGVRALDEPDLWAQPWFREKLLRALAHDGFDQPAVDAVRAFFAANPTIATFENFKEAVAAAGAGSASSSHLQRAAAHFEKVRATNAEVYGPKTNAEYKARYWPNNLKLLQTNWELHEDIFTADICIEKHRFITKETPIASAGSCFAANIALQLQHWGYNYLVEMGERQPRDQPRTKWNPIYEWETDFAGIGNIYNAMSMRQMFERGFGYWEPEKLLMFSKPSLFDPFRMKVDYSDVDGYLARFEEHNKALRRALEKCEVFILTLGLSEAWVFADSNLALVGAPKRCDATLMRPRNLTVQDNVNELERIYEIFKRHNPAVHIIATVSPVPLNATYNMDRHVVVANGLSKATVRVALDEFSRAHPKDVTYFPAYELVTSGTRRPWQADMRHVTNEAIARVMRQFQETYFVDQTPLEIALLEEVEEFIPTRRNYLLKYGRELVVHPLKRKLGIEGKPFRSLLKSERA